MRRGDRGNIVQVPRRGHGGAIPMRIDLLIFGKVSGCIWKSFVNYNILCIFW
jgi:hypothetical protein